MLVILTLLKQEKVDLITLQVKVPDLLGGPVFANNVTLRQHQ